MLEWYLNHLFLITDLQLVYDNVYFYPTEDCPSLESNVTGTNYEYNWGTSGAHHSRVQVTCQPGYMLGIDNHMQCDGGTWKSKPLSCQRETQRQIYMYTIQPLKSQYKLGFISSNPQSGKTMW